MAFWPYLYNQSFGGGSAPGGSGNFFGTVSMFREFWVEDPQWTPPTPDTALTSLVRDNGTAGEDLNQIGGDVIYRAPDTTIGKPAWDFGVDASLALRTTNGQMSGTFTNFVVFAVDTLGVTNTLIDAGAVKNQGFMSVNASNQYRAYTNNGSVELSDGAADNKVHLMMTVFENNNTRIYVDGVLLALDSDCSLADAYGFTIGCNYAVTAGGLYGAVAYAGQYAGDLTLDPGYADWLNGIMSYYEIPAPAAKMWTSVSYGSGSRTLTLPQAAEANDLIMVICVGDNTNNPTVSGYTTIANLTGSFAARDYAAYYKVAAGGETSVTVNNASGLMSAAAVVFQGVNPSNPVDAAYVLGTSSGGNAFPTPDITTNTDNAIVVGWVWSTDPSLGSTGNVNGYHVLISGPGGVDYSLVLGYTIKETAGLQTGFDMPELFQNGHRPASIAFRTAP